METNNKLREALNDIIDKIKTWGNMDDWLYSELFDIADTALAASPRNCDVGTASEQESRFSKFCGKQIFCRDCPLFANSSKVECEFSFLQMPYEEGGSK